MSLLIEGNLYDFEAARRDRLEKLRQAALDVVVQANFRLYNGEIPDLEMADPLKHHRITLFTNDRIVALTDYPIIYSEGSWHLYGELESGLSVEEIVTNNKKARQGLSLNLPRVAARVRSEHAEALMNTHPEDMRNLANTIARGTPTQYHVFEYWKRRIATQ